MKKVASFLVCIYSLVFIQAQDYSLSNNVLKISPVEFVRSEFKISYERYFDERRHSILLTPTLIYKGESGDERQGFRTQAQYRYYMTHLNSSNGNEIIGLPNVGIYAGVYGSYLLYSESYEMSFFDQESGVQQFRTIDRSINAQEGGALVGLQVDLTQRFVFDFYIGGGVRFSEAEWEGEQPGEEGYDSRSSIFPYDYKGIKPTIGFMIGLLL